MALQFSGFVNLKNDATGERIEAAVIVVLDDECNTYTAQSIDRSHIVTVQCPADPCGMFEQMMEAVQQMAVDRTG